MAMKGSGWQWLAVIGSEWQRRVMEAYTETCMAASLRQWLPRWTPTGVPPTFEVFFVLVVLFC